LIDIEEGETSGGFGLHSNWPRGENLSKEELKHDASTIGLRESLKEITSFKESSSGKRGKIGESMKDEHFKGFMDILPENYGQDAAALRSFAFTPILLPLLSWMKRQGRGRKKLISSCSWRRHL
jgi:hypothetical protein